MIGPRVRAGLWLALVAFVAAALPLPTAAEMGEPPFNHVVLFEEFEYGFSPGESVAGWDATSWVGGDWNRLWLKTEGEVAPADSAGDGEAQLLYSRLVAPFWELQFGVRGDLAVEDGQRGRARGHLVLAVAGLAPYWFEVEPALFVSHRGDASARFRATYDLFITQRLIVHPGLEMNLAIQSVPKFGVGAGLNDLELGLRIGYQLARECTPYAGVSWNRAFAETARLRRQAGGAPSELSGVAGLRFWF